MPSPPLNNSASNNYPPNPIETEKVLSTSRGFTEEEDQYFADAARKAYVSFITKAAASRNMTVDAMNEVTTVMIEST